MIANWEDKRLMGLTDDNDAFFDGSIGRQNINNISQTGDTLVDGVLSGFAWRGGKITYAFPDNKNDYDYNGEPAKAFGSVSGKIQAAAQFILDQAYGNKANDGFSLEGFTKLAVAKGGDGSATLRYAESSKANPTAYGYYPSSSDKGGDVWFGTSWNYSDAISGNYNFATVIHETGHALGLKHGHQAAGGFPKLPGGNDSLEYSVMTYNSFVGDDATGYKNEHWGYPQTYMMSDIAALQHMYGADFGVNSGSTTYSWRPGNGNTYVNGKVGIDAGANRIFATIWDGGGNHDTYNLRAYTNGVTIDLSAGGHSVFKASQLADLGAFLGNNLHNASGNIYNALLYHGDTRSLIEDAIGGSGNDTIIGNQAANGLKGGLGTDSLTGSTGVDTFFFRTGWGSDTVMDFANGTDKIDLQGIGFNDISDVNAIAFNSGADVILNFGGGNVLTLKNIQEAQLDNTDFVF